MNLKDIVQRYMTKRQTAYDQIAEELVRLPAEKLAALRSELLDKLVDGKSTTISDNDVMRLRVACRIIERRKERSLEA